MRNGLYPLWTIEPVASEQDIKAQQFIMLTVSSYDFRMVLALHFSPNEASQRYVAQTLDTATAALENARYYDYLSEVGNTFCGAFKRELGAHFPHLGMSTPNLLMADSRPYMHTWPVDHEVHLRAYAEGATEFFGSLYVSSTGNLDFQINESAPVAETAETGALELF